jgi:sulfite oxidase
VLLAWAMNGQSLPPVHGAPLRVVVPGYIGARSVKWVDRITVQDHPSDNYFQATAYRLLPPGADPAAARPGDGLPLGPVAVNSAILQPEDGAVLTAGPARISGYAIAGDDLGIARVDVSIDGGQSWCQADLGANAGPWAWRIWSTVVRLPGGTTEVLVRAQDTAGSTQPESPGQVWNPKGYVNNSWARLHVTVR